MGGEEWEISVYPRSIVLFCLQLDIYAIPHWETASSEIEYIRKVYYLDVFPGTTPLIFFPNPSNQVCYCANDHFSLPPIDTSGIIVFVMDSIAGGGK